MEGHETQEAASQYKQMQIIRQRFTKPNFRIQLKTDIWLTIFILSHQKKFQEIPELKSHDNHWLKK